MYCIYIAAIDVYSIITRVLAPYFFSLCNGSRKVLRHARVVLYAINVFLFQDEG